MSLEYALLDRLEKRSLQIAQQHNEINGLRELVDEKMAINEQLAEQITTARLEREQMQHQIAELRTERDRILEASRSLVPKSALKQAVLEAAELHGALNDAQGEIQKLRAEVPLESTREALKNAVAKLQEVTTDRDRLVIKFANLGSYAMTIGRKEGEPLEMFMERQALRLAALESKAGPSIETLSAELSVRYAEIAELHKWATGLIENPGFAQNAPERTMHYREIVERINSRPQLDLNAMLPAVDWQAICTKREDEIARLNAKVGPLEKLYEVVKKHVDHGAIIDNRADIYDAVAETAKALSQLTA